MPDIHSQSPQSDSSAVSATVQPDDTAQVRNEEKLAAFEAALYEVEAARQEPVAAEPQQPQAADTIQQPYVPSTTGVRKEVAPSSEVSPIELPGGLQPIESEPNPEIPVEVQDFLQKVEEDTAHLPEEIVIAAEQHAQQQQQQLPQRVKVLPITKEQEREGKKKSPAFSIRWLVAFSEKLAEIFRGKAVYRSSE